MQQQVERQDQLFQLIPTKQIPGVSSNIITLGRYLVGRIETCDIIVPVKGISAIHAILEVTPSGVKVYDMNSKNGTLVDGNKIVAKGIELNGRVTFGNVEFVLKKYSADPELPPVLPLLDPLKGEASVLKTSQKLNHHSLKKKEHLPKVPKELPQKVPLVEEDLPYIIYPLASDPKSAYSEYIFEDTDNLYPIFKYEIDKQSFEVIILYKDKVYSVDYLSEKDGVYKIAGLTSKKEEVEFPYLGASEAIPFIEVQKGNCLVHQLHNYSILHLQNGEVKSSNKDRVNLQGDEVVKLNNGDLEIFVRKVSSPPKVKTPPFFRRDKDLRKYVVLMFLLILFPLIGLNLYEVDDEIKDDKDPERIATILYRQKLTLDKNKTVESSKKEPVKEQKAPTKPVVKKEEPKPIQASSQKSIKKTEKKSENPGAKKAEKQQKVKVVKNPAPKKSTVSKTVTSAASASVSKVSQTRRANVNSKSQGHVDAYKSFNFKSSMNSLLAKGGKIQGARTAQTSSNSLSGAEISGGVSSQVSKASVGTEVGSLVGSTEGKLAETKGTEGLSAKSGVYTVGIPSETVVLGSIDPDVIRRILRDHIPFFRSCYQKELNKNAGKDIYGTIRLGFIIGASGYVTKAGVSGKTSIPGPVKSCVVGVLRGIKFPQPRGGGTVEVKQPFNFFAKKL